MFCGISSIFCMDPFAAMILFFILSFHKPSATRSFNKCLFTITNSPLNTLREYILLVYGSKHSLLPRICDVEAVGMGASNSELRTPYFFTSSFNTSHSQRLLGVTPHISNWKIPSETGEPMKLSYGPSMMERSFDAV